jgi:hypothetical protein
VFSCPIMQFLCLKPLNTKPAGLTCSFFSILNKAVDL